MILSVLFGLTADDQSPASSIFDITVNKLKYLWLVKASKDLTPQIFSFLRHMYIFPTNYLYHPFRLPSPAVQQDVGLFAQLQHHFAFCFDNLICLLGGRKLTFVS